MIHYTDRISLLMRDIVARVPSLSYISPDELLVFARYGRRGANGAFATCHCISMPQSDPGYYYWRDRQTGRITRRSRWFVTKSPTVYVGGRKLRYLISFSLPRFCDQKLPGSRKAQFYDRNVPAWYAKLDTIVHELYHIDPLADGIRRVERCDGLEAMGSHGRLFLEQVADMVREYLATGPDPAVYEFLSYGFAELNEVYGGVAGTTFRSFPSYPQRYIEVLPPAQQPETTSTARIEALKLPALQTSYCDFDLVTRQFLDRTTLGMARRGSSRQRSRSTEIQLPSGVELQGTAATRHDR